MYSFECPVKPGQTVYDIEEDDRGHMAIIKKAVRAVAFDDFGYLLISGSCHGFSRQCDWLKYCFQTREEAEAALKKMEEELK